jgi:HSP20 family protein
MAQEGAKTSKEQERRQSGEERSATQSEARRPAMRAPSPFGLMRRVMEDLDGLFEGFGGLTPRSDLSSRSGERGRSAWVPAVDVVEGDGQLVIRADVPGLNKDQIQVEVQDGNLVISGERKEEHEERQSGVYRVERSYGSFYRVVPLPEGVNAEQAKASFANGVLEITMPAPQQPQPRRLEIKEGASAQQTQQAKSA